jgi:hypothetical protein
LKPFSQTPAPLFCDPIFNGASDPVPVWNEKEQAWWLIYTQRRAGVETPGFEWCHGTSLGVASSRDGAEWTYEGTLRVESPLPGANTFWSPEILWHDGLYHLFPSFVPGVPGNWSGDQRILHHTSPDLWNWKLESELALSSKCVIDPCVHRLPNGKWRMWYKDQGNKSATWAADSDDLSAWEVIGPVITDCGHEGPNVFHWNGWYWMIIDVWQGQAAYRSRDCEHWMRQPGFLLQQSGHRPEDAGFGFHADVLVSGPDAYVFYHTHPGWPQLETRPFSLGTPGVPFSYRHSALQVARLKFQDDAITCDRDEPFEFHPCPPDASC